MRYQLSETIYVAQQFFTGQTVTVELVNLSTGVLTALDAGTTSEASGLDGLFIWDTDDITTPPAVSTQYMVVMTESTSGRQKMSKITVGGYLEDLDAPISGLNDLSIANVQTALTNQGYTVARAALISNLDQVLSTTQTNITNAISALNDLSSADVQGAMTAQGYTVARGVLLSNLDQVLSTTQTNITNAISALNDIDVAGILAGVLGSGESVDMALSRVDNMDITLAALDELLQGGRNIDFTGNDSLGWQRVERNKAGAEVARYNLFDETDARITGTVSAFIIAQKMIASEVKI